MTTNSKCLTDARPHPFRPAVVQRIQAATCSVAPWQQRSANMLSIPLEPRAAGPHLSGTQDRKDPQSPKPRTHAHHVAFWAPLSLQDSRILPSEARERGKACRLFLKSGIANGLRRVSLGLLLIEAGLIASSAVLGDQAAQQAGAVWRAEHRLIDVHQHVDYSEAALRRDVRLMDSAGIGLVVNLSGGFVTHQPGEKSAFERNKELADRLFPGRFLHYMSLDFAGWDDPDFEQRAVQQIEEGYRLGAAGLKEFKRLGLYLKDKAGRLIRVDDPKLDPVWRRCGELGMPVSIHVADPQAFWKPYDATNERWRELKDHPQWWFGDPAKYPPFDDLLAALDRVIARHPQTTFVCVHFANNAEDLDWVERALDRRPNMRADLAARIPEIGRHDPARVRQLVLKHQDRILFGTDFMVYDELTLGSGGSGPVPTDADALDFFAKHWRWLETADRQFDHMTPIQGDWRIDAIDLPASVLRKIYFDNARRLLVRSQPLRCSRPSGSKRTSVPTGASTTRPGVPPPQPVSNTRSGTAPRGPSLPRSRASSGPTGSFTLASRLLTGRWRHLPPSSKAKNDLAFGIGMLSRPLSGPIPPSPTTTPSSRWLRLENGSTSSCGGRNATSTGAAASRPPSG